MSILFRGLIYLEGRAPFQLMYNVARNSETGGTRILDQPIISSIQPRIRIQLLTSQTGRIYYEVKQVGDANYPLAQNKHHVIPRRDRLLFEQEVLGRPSAQFKRNARLTHCLRDTFTPGDGFSMDDMVILEGKPPFHLELSVKSLAASEVHRQTVEIWDTQWRVNLPNYMFTSIGPHLVTIESVRDASSCDPASADPLNSFIWVDVAESAAIVPFDRREHFCVGEVTQFQLEGIPPWTIGYVAIQIDSVEFNVCQQIQDEPETTRTSSETLPIRARTAAPRGVLYHIHLTPTQAMQDSC